MSTILATTGLTANPAVIRSTAKHSGARQSVLKQSSMINRKSVNMSSGKAGHQFGKGFLSLSRSSQSQLASRKSVQVHAMSVDGGVELKPAKSNLVSQDLLESEKMFKRELLKPLVSTIPIPARPGQRRSTINMKLVQNSMYNYVNQNANQRNKTYSYIEENRMEDGQTMFQIKHHDGQQTIILEEMDEAEFENSIKHGTQNSPLYDACQKQLLDELVAVQNFIDQQTQSLDQDGFIIEDRNTKISPIEKNKIVFYNVVAQTLRDEVHRRWSQEVCDQKQVYYMSLDYQLGRQMQQAMTNIGLDGQYGQVLEKMVSAVDMQELLKMEQEKKLGPLSLGKLAACFMDSLSTMGVQAVGYGLRTQEDNPDFNPNEHVAIKQKFRKNPFEVERHDIEYSVRLYDNYVVKARAFDTPITGYNSDTINTVRLWKAISSDKCNDIAHQIETESEDKEAQLIKQFFLCSASIQDMIRRYRDQHGDDMSKFPEMAQVQLNDTQPAFAPLELYRIFMDEMGMQQDVALNLVKNTFNFTNHTVRKHAIQEWRCELVQKVLPRHFELIRQLDCQNLNQKLDLNIEKHADVEFRMFSEMQAASIFNFVGPCKRLECIKMAQLSLLLSKNANGISEIHTELLNKQTFGPFLGEAEADKFQNITNGVNHRRWIAQANPELADLITRALGSNDWLSNPLLLKGLEDLIENDQFLQAFAQVKMNNKRKLQKYVKDNCNVDIPLNAMYDIQVKRINLYKRQLSNVFHVINQFNDIKATPEKERSEKFVPRVVMIGMETAPEYEKADQLKRFMKAVSERVNNDPEIGDWLKLVLLPNHNISSFETILAGGELLQHISTAGTESSGNSNLKFLMNGGLFLGSQDGINYEIEREVMQKSLSPGITVAENLTGAPKEDKNAQEEPDYIIKFGLNAHGTNRIAQELIQGNRQGKDSMAHFSRKAIMSIKKKEWGVEILDDIIPIILDMQERDDFDVIITDFTSYTRANERAARQYRDQRTWNQLAVKGIANSGNFSSDRMIYDYCQKIWDIKTK